MPNLDFHTLNGRVSSLTVRATENQAPPTGRIDLLPDALGSVIQTLVNADSAGTSARYAGYGSQLYRNGDWGLPRPRWIGSLGYRSTQLKHAEQYVRARHYSSGESRWTSVDPLWPREKAYLYVSGNPATWTDPSGLCMQVIPPTNTNPGAWPGHGGYMPPGTSPGGSPGGWPGHGGYFPPARIPIGPPSSIPPISVPGGGLPSFPTLARGGIIICGAIAIVDLCRWACTGETGPVTGIGEDIGEHFFPDPTEVPVKPGTVRDPTKCSEEERVKRQREKDAACGKPQREFGCDNISKNKKKELQKEIDAIRKCSRARSRICECYFGGCDKPHEDMIRDLDDVLYDCYEKKDA